MQHFANLRALFIIHNAKVQRNIFYAIECTQRGANTILNFVTQWTTSDGQHHRQADYAALHLYVAHHSEVDNGTV